MSHSIEFIGGKIKVLSAKNKSLEGLEGTIIDETKNTFKIQAINSGEKRTEKKEKTKKIILKNNTSFLINGQEIIGDEIIKKPEERIKRRN